MDSNAGRSWREIRSEAVARASLDFLAINSQNANIHGFIFVLRIKISSFAHHFNVTAWEK
jgi:hypothetical protein